jgi:aryl-alcohol dehydrogenase-like predicted oxidoreductase
VCEQPPYSILARGIETEVLPTCQRYGMGTIVWSPLNGGWLTGRYRKDAPLPEGGRASRMPARYDPSRPQVKAKLEAIEALLPVAEEAGVPLSHLALSFVLTHPAVTAAIIGPRTMEQLVDAIAAVDVGLSDTTLDQIDAVVGPGVTLDPTDSGWTPPSVSDPWRRRRPSATRSSGR